MAQIEDAEAAVNSLNWPPAKSTTNRMIEPTPSRSALNTTGGVRSAIVAIATLVPDHVNADSSAAASPIGAHPTRTFATG